MGRFTAGLKNRAWQLFNEVKIDQLLLTPGEYDVLTLAGRVATRMRHEHGLDYSKVVTYLETRYKEQDDE